MQERNSHTGESNGDATATEMRCWPVAVVRRYLGRLIAGGEIVEHLARFCRQKKIAAARFSLSGTVSTYTIGSFDETQRVWVTHRQASAATIASAYGTILPRSDDGTLFVQAQALFSDASGQLEGGRLFPPTIAHQIEFELQVLSGVVPRRYCNPKSGLFDLHA